MQTFLPYADFARSAAVLDSPRLGKQRVEVLQVLRALELPEYGWASHPAVVMWRGRTPALVVYGLACVAAWRARGHADATEELIGEFAPEVVGTTQPELAAMGMLPSWVGLDDLHLSHRSALVRKDPELYRPVFGDDLPDDLPYFWPGADDVPELPVAAGGGLWVVRPPDAAALGTFVGEGVIGLDDASGIDVDAAERDGAGLRALLAERAAAREEKRRPGKALRQLQTLLEDVQVGQEVAVPVEGGRGLLLGEVSGPYAFADPRRTPVCHRRPVRWQTVVPRASVDRPAVLQDPRALFRVRLVLDARETVSP